VYLCVRDPTTLSRTTTDVVAARSSTVTPLDGDIDLEGSILMPARPPRAYLTWHSLQDGGMLELPNRRSNTWS
jgi:hypothetical protein